MKILILTSILVAVQCFGQAPTVIQPTDTVKDSRAVINDNFANLFSGSATVANVKGAPYRAAGNGTTDDTAAIQAAITAVCTGTNPGTVYFPHGTYKITSAITHTGQHCTLMGESSWGSILSHAPTVAGTDMLTFLGSTVYVEGNGLYHLKLTSSTTGSRRLLYTSNQTNFTLNDVPFRASSTPSVNHWYMEQMIATNVINSPFFGPTTADLVVIAASPTTTTVNFNASEFVNGTAGACLKALGGAGSGSIVVSGGILETCNYGLWAETNVVAAAVHFERNTTHEIYCPSTCNLQTSALNLQHNGTSAYVNIQGGNWLDDGTSQWPGMSATQTLVNADGAFVRLPQNAFTYPTYPSGTIFAGTGTLAHGILPHRSYSASSVSGTLTTASFRGDTYIIAVTGTTTIHIGGCSTGGATPEGLPPGERITFILSTNGSQVLTGSGNTGDCPIVGQINGSGLANGAIQVIQFVMDASGNFVVSSPGWVSSSTGTGLPSIGSSGSFTPALTFGNASTGLTYAARSGEYYKVGRMVTVQIAITLLTKGSSTGAARITGLPFTNGAAIIASGQIGYYEQVAGITSPTVYVSPGASIANLVQQTSAVVTGALADTNFSDTSQINLTITYYAAS